MSVQSEMGPSLRLPRTPSSLKLESSLLQTLDNFKELIVDLEKLQIESETCKSELLSQKQRCESKNCSSSEALKKDIAAKDNVIQLAASTLTRLNETKNFRILDEVFQILCGESPILTPPKENLEPDKVNDKYPENLLSLKKEQTSVRDISMKNESISEIEDTPTGRKSPILQFKPLKSMSNNTADCRDKKKCPNNWTTSENKTLKLIYRTPSKGKRNGKLKQTRLSVVTSKPSNIIDLCSSPEIIKPTSCKSEEIQMLVKKESIEDDTILPSPTSGPPNYPSLLKSSLKSSPSKVKRSLSCLIKTENDRSLNGVDKEFANMEQSINLLKQMPNRHKASPKSPDNDVTHCDVTASISILQNVTNLKKQIVTNGENKSSPQKRPLAENINFGNLPTQEDVDSSLSLLQKEQKTTTSNDNVKRKTPDRVEPVYKEPIVRKKAEKRLLPGWSCEECQTFYAELYKDDPEMLAKKMHECSKHRGRNNPARPKTPPGFWYPRWDVPDDTEEINKRNHAL